MYPPDRPVRLSCLPARSAHRLAGVRWRAAFSPSAGLPWRRSTRTAESGPRIRICGSAGGTWSTGRSGRRDTCALMRPARWWAVQGRSSGFLTSLAATSGRLERAWNDSDDVPGRPASRAAARRSAAMPSSVSGIRDRGRTAIPSSQHRSTQRGPSPGKRTDRAVAAGSPHTTLGRGGVSWMRASVSRRAGGAGAASRPPGSMSCWVSRSAGSVTSLRSPTLDGCVSSTS